LSAHPWRNSCRRAATAETGGGGRWKLCSDELVARPEQRATEGATGDPRAGKSNTRWRCKRSEGGARRGHHWRWQWRLGVWAMRAAASLTPFIGARTLWRGSRSSKVWVLQGGGEARRHIAAQGRRGARTSTSRLAGRRGVLTHGARGEDRDGGSQGRPTTHGPAGQSRPRRACPAGPRRGSVRVTPQVFVKAN
jgi:hypothetical protein